MARGDEVRAPGVEPGNWVEVEMAEEDAEGVVRVDTGVREGGEISIHYDPMISKLIVHGPGRRLQKSPPCHPSRLEARAVASGARARPLQR